MLDYDAIAAVLDSGVSMVGASADDRLMPEVFRTWGASLRDGGALRALVSSDAGETFRRVEQGTPLCMTFADPLNLRSVQLKGRSVGPAEAPGPDDLACMERYEAVLGPKSLLNGTPPDFLEAVRPRSVFAVSMVIEEAYDQTPGPKAGTNLDGEP